MFSWINIPQAPEATWLEVTTLYVSNYLKRITYSEFDHPEKTIVLRNVPSISVGEELFGIDFKPLIFLSSFYVQTLKGK